MVDNMSLVSVIIPTYNREKLISKAINSVIKQDYSDWEIIIVDDRSTDHTKELIEKFIRSDSRIKYYINQRSKGPGGARNYGIEQASGEYIAFLDSDDEWLEQHLSDCIDVLQREEYQVCFSLWYEYRSGVMFRSDEIGQRQNRLNEAIKDLSLRVEGRRIFLNEKFYEYNLLKQVYCYHINTLVLRKSVLETTGYFNEELFASEDMDFIYRLLYYCKSCLIRDYHSIYYEGVDNIYSFMDRSNADLKKILQNDYIVGKLTLIGKSKNRMRAIRKKFIKNVTKIENKKVVIKELDELIAKKYFTLGYLNCKLHKIQAIFYCFKSIQYGFSWYKNLLVLKMIILPGLATPINISNLDLG